MKLLPNEKLHQVAGTPNYIAPEIIGPNSSGYSYPVDIWAIGCIIYTLLVGRTPFQSSTRNDTFEKIRNGSYSWPQYLHISPTIKDLVGKMLQVNPSLRPTATECLHHPFFDDKIPRYLFNEKSEIPEKFIKGNQFNFYADINDI